MSKLPDFYFEKLLWGKGYGLIGGIDEVGVGAFAGPVVVACVVFLPKITEEMKTPPARRSSTMSSDESLGVSSEAELSRFQRDGGSSASAETGSIRLAADGIKKLRNEEIKISSIGRQVSKIDDSKRLTSGEREVADEWIKEMAYVWGIGQASVYEIDKIGMGKAKSRAQRRAVINVNKSLKNSGKESLEYLLNDGHYIPYIGGYPRGMNTNIVGIKRWKDAGKIIAKNNSKQLAVIKGDRKSFSIASASIIAKVFRDKLMRSLSNKSKYKKYMWGKNKGYGTRSHIEALKLYGLTNHHRAVYIRNFVSG